MQAGDRVLIPAFFLEEIPVEGGTTQANIQIAGPGNNTIQIQAPRVIAVTPPTGGSSIQLELELDAAVWGS